MARRQVLVQLNDELLALLDQRAAKSGRSRSDLIRGAIERDLEADLESAIDRAIVEGYTRIPPGELNAWADASARRSIQEEPW